jgi:hypothetical protein
MTKNATPLAAYPSNGNVARSVRAAIARKPSKKLLAMRAAVTEDRHRLEHQEVMRQLAQPENALYYFDALRDQMI